MHSIFLVIEVFNLNNKMMDPFTLSVLKVIIYVTGKELKKGGPPSGIITLYLVTTICSSSEKCAALPFYTSGQKSP